jgi:integrase
MDAPKPKKEQGQKLSPTEDFRANPTDKKALAIPPTDARQEISAGGGLYLVIERVDPETGKGGLKRWTSRGRKADGTQVNFPLGEFAKDGKGDKNADPPKLTVKLAKAANDEARQAFKDGRDLAAERKAKRKAKAEQTANTFAKVAKDYLRLECAGMKTVDQMEKRLELYCRPLLTRPIDSIKRSQIRALLYGIKTKAGESKHAKDGQRTAEQTYSLLRSIFNWHALGHDHFVNPIVVGLWETTARERDRAFTDDEVKRIWMTAETAGQFGKLLQFLILTGARRSEASEMTWDEYDETTGVWTLPAERNKISTPEKPRPLLRQLSDMARDLLAKQERNGEYVFQVGGHPMSGWGPRKERFDKACGIPRKRADGTVVEDEKWVIHDLRSMARSLMSAAVTTDTNGNEHTIDNDVAEMCLGHLLNGQRKTYDRYKYANEKRAAYEALAKMLGAIVELPPENVVVIPTARKG